MKRIFTILLLTCVVLQLVAQEEINVDHIKYQILNDEDVAVMGVDSLGKKSDLTIPATIEYQKKTYTVVAIGRRAFETQNWLTNITIPNTIRTIGERAFQQSNYLTSIKIPASVTSVSGNPFTACLKLTSIIVEDENPVYDSRNNCNAIIETATNTLVSGCINTVIPNTITAIGGGAFCGIGITSVNIPNGVKSIGNAAFAINSKLTSVTIPASVTAITGKPFYRCSALTSIKVADGNTVYDSRNNCNAIIETATNTLITGCNNSVIPTGITSIADTAFYGSGISSVVIPNTVTKLGKGAFNATLLTSIVIPYGVTKIGAWAFGDCKELPVIEFPNSVTTIEALALSNCSKISVLTIPSSVINMGVNPFAGCSALTSINVAEDNLVYDSRNNCNAIIETATNTLISGCMNTVIPEEITTIGSNAFDGCKDLASIVIPNNVILIKSRAFAACSALTTFTFPEKTAVIESLIFFNSKVEKLNRIVCSSLVPPSVIDELFYLDGRRHLYYSIPLYVLCDAYEAYKNHAVWGQFENIECRSLNASDIEDIAINDGEALPTIDLSEYFSSDDGEVVFSAKSSDNRVVYPVVMGNRLGFVQYGTGKAEITVTATVEPLSRSRSFTISINSETPPQECELTLSAKITSPKCYGGEDGKIELTVIGGTEPYYYKWSNGRTDGTLSGVGAGTYSVLVADENGCTAEKSFTIGEADSIVIAETIVKPKCGGNTGKITLNVTGGTEPYAYKWTLPNGQMNVDKDLANLKADSYTITVTDANSCKSTKVVDLPDNGAATIQLKSVEASKCNEPTGSIEVEVSGGVSPITYRWSDSTNVSRFVRPSLFPGNYKFKTVDNKNCRSSLLVTVPMRQFRQPEISLVSYGDTAGHNLVIWQKEQTDEIEKYYVFRETKDAGNYDRIGSLAYNETSIYVDETANHNTTWCRYRISAANQCGESQLSYAYKTMRLQRKRVNGGLLLWWNSYEGFEFVKYTLYKLTNTGLEKYVELPANKYRYTVNDLEPNTIGFFVTVELTEIVDVTQPMKAEGGPFAIAFSNLAEVENADAIEEVEENQAVVYSKDKKIIIVNAQNKNIFVCDVTGKLVAQWQNVDSAEIPVKTAGVYVVIVGKNVFKVMVN